MSGSPDETAPSVKLHCLGGREAPPEIAGDLRLIEDMPARAREDLFRVLGPCLAEEPAGRGLEERLEQFCRSNAVTPGDLTRVIKSARFLFREAARIELDAERFERDLAALLGDGGEKTKEALLSGYEAAMGELRAEIVEGSLADHGKLLVDIGWRVDTLSTSDRGVKLRTPVVLLTLRYREGDRQERITLQALPSVLEELRRICEHILE
jgi:hypothetical protein